METFRTRGFCGYCSVASNENRRFDLLVGLANDQSIMGDRSQEEQALMKIQDEWAEARIKGDGSYTLRIEADDCTIVWPDGRIVNKQSDLQSMTGDIDRHICETGRSMEGRRFPNHSGKLITHS